MRIIFLSLIISIATSSFCFADISDWKSFFDKPDAENYEILRKHIEDSINGGYQRYEEPVWKDLTIPYETAPFYKLISEGNPYALKLAFQVYPIMFGHAGVLEALYRSISRLTESNPKLVLLEMSKASPKYKNGKYDCKFVTFFGEKFVDRPKEALSAKVARKELLLSINDKEVLEIRDACIINLEKSIERLQLANE